MSRGPTTNRSRMAHDRIERPHYVYQLWGAHECIYVGITANLGQRLTAHATKDWWPDVKTVKAELYPGKYAALDVERDLIQELDPIANRLSRL